jgi:hypothetical protein
MIDYSYILVMAELGSGYISIALALATEQVQSLFLIVGCLLIGQDKFLLSG